jgi:hypothetical protein
MRPVAILLVTVTAASACGGTERDADPPPSLLGGRAWVTASSAYANTHALAVAFVDRDGDGRLTPMAEPAFPCEVGGDRASPRCRFPARRAVVNSYRSVSSITGDRHEGLAVWVQDASARPAAIPFCTQMGCSKEQPPFFDRRADNPAAFHQYWVCTADPAGEVGVIELDVAGGVSRIEARPHLAIDLTQEWTPDGLRISMAASHDVSRVSVRVTRRGEPVWSSEHADAVLQVNARLATAVIPEEVISCLDDACLLIVDAAHIWQDDAALVLSASHLEEPLLRSSRP